MPAEWAVAFLLGLLSSTHCLGMCGGIAGALTFSLSPEVRRQPRWLMAFNLAYNLGRITSYVVAGVLVAASAGWLMGLVGTPDRLVMGSLGMLFLVAVGLHIAGWFPRFSRIERLGRPLWRRWGGVCCRSGACPRPGGSGWCGAGSPAGWSTRHCSTG